MELKLKKNTVLAVVLSMLVFGGWMYIQQKYFPVENVVPPAENVAKIDSATLQNTFSQEQSPLINIIDNNVGEQELPAREETYTIETDLIRVVFTNKGGDIISYKLKEHASAGSDERIEMIENRSEADRALSLSFGGANVKPVDLLFNVKEETLADGKKTIGFYRDISVKNSADGTETVFTLAKRYTFIPSDYMFTLEVTIDGKNGMKGLTFGDEAYTLRSAPQIGPQWDKNNDKYEYRSFSYLSGDKKKQENGISEGKTKVITSISSWAAVSGKYFAFIVLPNEPIKKMTFSGQKSNGAKIQNSQIFISRPPITSSSINDIYHIYIGPSSEKILNRYNSPLTNSYNLQNTRLDSIASSGGFWYPLEWLLKNMMELLYKLIPNWGIAVILLTLLMRIIFFPLTKKSSQATKKMQELQPKIAELQAKYKNNPQKLNAEMARFYKEAGYNPLAGCLPMLIQIPFWFAMYRLFNNYFEFRGASFIPGWIPDLSIGDSIYKLNFALPILGWTDIRVLPAIYVASQLLYGKLTQTPGQEQQNASMKMMIYFMPIIFFFILYNAPSGLLLFWTMSNILMLLQQVCINKKMKK